ncbi:MAG: hypothetical protein HQL72_10315 [Magnetococcales bacterium]|nr:hypothetical protein [Magnetococcales bacterium]
MSASGGVVTHTLCWQEKIPIGVDLTLRGGVVVRVDLIEKRVVAVEGGELKPKKIQWCLHIADYLARQALLELQEKANKKRSDGRSSIQFEPRPDPNITWWG